MDMDKDMMVWLDVEIQWLKGHLLTARVVQSQAAEHVDLTQQSTWKPRQAGFRYLSILPHLKRLGRQFLNASGQESVGIRYPEFVLDPCMLHRQTDTTDAIGLCETFERILKT